MKDITGREYIYGIAQDKNGAPYLFNVGELVRCKDCIEGNHRTSIDGDNIKWCDVVGMNVTDDDFCSWAKMKGGAE